MKYELISEEDYASLPEDDQECFVNFEAICRENMTRIIHDNSSPEFDEEVHQQYMSVVAAAATECKIPNVRLLSHDDQEHYDAYKFFSSSVQGEIAKICIRRRGARHSHSVQLLPNTRTIIDLISLSSRRS